MVAVLVALCFSCVFLTMASSAHGGVDEILEYKFTRDENGGYSYRFKTSNGIEREETGKFVKDAEDSVILKVVGYYKFLKENGEVEEVLYRAGKNGFAVISPSVGQHQKQHKNLQAEEQTELEAPASEDYDGEDVGTKIQSCVLASLCGTAPYGR